MKRRDLLKASLFGAAAGAPAVPAARKGALAAGCDCAPAPAAALALPSSPRLKVTKVKTFGVTADYLPSDRPHIFVKLETDAGVVGWGEATLEGKAASAMQAVHDFEYAIVGQDPMQVEHHWQSMYIHAFYRSGPVLASAISGIDQALWDIRGKVLGKPVYELLGGPVDERGVRGYYHLLQGPAADRLPRDAPFRERLALIRELAEQHGVTAFKTGVPGYYEWLDTHERIKEAIDHLRTIREVMGDKIDIGVDFHAKTSPTVAVTICKEIEDLNLMFVEEPCPPENVKAMKRISSRTTVPIATGERLITHYGCREVIEQKVVDIIQTDVNHVGGISALWKVGAMAEASGVLMAPHACASVQSWSRPPTVEQSTDLYRIMVRASMPAAVDRSIAQVRWVRAVVRTTTLDTTRVMERIRICPNSRPTLNEKSGSSRLSSSPRIARRKFEKPSP